MNDLDPTTKIKTKRKKVKIIMKHNKIKIKGQRVKIYEAATKGLAEASQPVISSLVDWV